jgi:hypothetical protein
MVLIGISPAYRRYSSYRSWAGLASFSEVFFLVPRFLSTGGLLSPAIPSGAGWDLPVPVIPVSGFSGFRFSLGYFIVYFTGIYTFLLL